MVSGILAVDGYRVVEQSSVAEALDYATFGARRAVGNPAGSGTSSTNTPRGFTGHEYVDGTDVIHMNGRIYDPTLGRFLQADPVIQDTSTPQELPSKR